jgi:hypothetical protein
MIRLAFIFGLLCALPSDGFCQGRRAARQSRWMRPLLEKLAADAAPEMAADAVKKALAKESFLPQLAHVEYLIDLDSSMRLFAQMQMDPTIREKLERDARSKELMSKGSASQFLSETAKFAEKLKAEKFSDPALGMMYFDVEDDTIITASKPGELSSQLTFKRDSSTGDRDSAAISSFFSVRARDAKQANPITVHCSFVFVTMKENKGYTKTLCFDVYLEELKTQEGVKVSYPWKVKSVEYK